MAKLINLQTDQAKGLAKDNILCLLERAGGVEVKGKGHHRTWWITSRVKHWPSLPNIALHYSDATASDAVNDMYCI